jgi:ATP citrate (pro-S)-lyase
VTPRFTTELEVSGARGALTHWIVEPFVPHKEEYYLAITSEREADVIHFSTHGGMEVEENWDKGLVKELVVPLGQTLESLHFDKALGVDTAPEAHQAKLKAFITAIFKVFSEQDFTLLELNPFTVAAAGEVVPLDMRAELDDCASYKHARDWDGIHFPAPFGRKFSNEENYINALDGKTGASLKLTIINPNGRVWLMVAGGAGKKKNASVR